MWYNIYSRINSVAIQIVRMYLSIPLIVQDCDSVLAAHANWKCDRGGCQRYDAQWYYRHDKTQVV